MKILATSAILLLPGIVFAQAMGGGMGMGGQRPDFEFFDQAGDGELTREELGAMVPDENIVDRIFMLDADGDGIVTKQEYDNPPAPPAGNQ